MKLIKCGRCGRPYYDLSETCPYCGHVLGSSSFDSEPMQPTAAEKTDVIPSKEEEHPTERKTVSAESTSVETVSAESTSVETVSAESTSVETVSAESTSVETVSNPQTVPASRADSMAAITASAADYSTDDTEIYDPNQIETVLPPRRCRTWLWIILCLLLAALTMAAYLFRDTLKQIVTSLLS